MKQPYLPASGMEPPDAPEMDAARRRLHRIRDAIATLREQEARAEAELADRLRIYRGSWWRWQ